MSEISNNPKDEPDATQEPKTKKTTKPATKKTTKPATKKTTKPATKKTTKPATKKTTKPATKKTTKPATKKTTKPATKKTTKPATKKTTKPATKKTTKPATKKTTKPATKKTTKPATKKTTKPAEESLRSEQQTSPKSVSDYLLLRSKINKRRPKFQTQETWRYKRIKTSWRKPKGFDSKMRIQKKGWPAIVKIGYRGPKAVRGLHPSGFKDILIYNIRGLENLNPSTDAIRLSSKIGKRYRLIIISEAEKQGFKILNKGNIGKR